MNLKSLQLIFKPDGTYLIDFYGVDGARATAQNATVNLLTEADSDLVYPERGTHILSAITKGGAYDVVSATHYANFAAADTLFFVRETDPVELEGFQQLADFKLVPTAAGRSLTLTASFVFQDGTVLGQPLNVNPI